MQSGADREVEEISGVSFFCCCFFVGFFFLWFFFFHPVPNQDYSQGGFNLQQGLMLPWVLLLMTFSKKQQAAARGGGTRVFFSGGIYLGCQD